MKAQQTVGRLNIVISATTGQLTSALQQAQQKVGGFAGRVSATTAVTSKLGAAITNISTALAKGGGLSAAMDGVAGSATKLAGSTNALAAAGVGLAAAFGTSLVNAFLEAKKKLDEIGESVLKARETRAEAIVKEPPGGIDFGKSARARLKEEKDKLQAQDNAIAAAQSEAQRSRDELKRLEAQGPLRGYERIGRLLKHVPGIGVGLGRGAEIDRLSEEADRNAAIAGRLIDARARRRRAALVAPFEAAGDAIRGANVGLQVQRGVTAAIEGAKRFGGAVAGLFEGDFDRAGAIKRIKAATKDADSDKLVKIGETTVDLDKQSNEYLSKLVQASEKESNKVIVKLGTIEKL